MGERRGGIRKRSDWAHRLDGVIAGARSKRYQIGDWDCAVFVADSIEAMSGADLMGADRGAYAAGPESYCGEPVLAFIARRIIGAGMVKVKPKFVRLGDVAAVETKHGLGLGVVLGAVVAVPVEPAGLEPVSGQRITHAWRIKE